jgi:cytochrome P450
MPDTAVLHRFVPPHWPIATRDPNFVELCQSPTNTLLGWSKAVYEGGNFQAKLPGASLVIGDADLAASILFDHPDEFPHGEDFDRLFRPMWGRGIFVSEGAEWKWQRRAAAPAFHAGRMKSFAPMMTAAADHAVAEWRASPGHVDLHDETRRITLRVLLDAALSGGEDFANVEEASRHIDRFIKGLGRFSLTDFMPIPNSWRPSTEARGGPSTAWLRSQVATMVARRRNSAPRNDLVDLLFNAVDPETGQRMDDELVRDNLIGFIAAGHETSAYALSWALWLVSQHAQRRERMLEEISAVAGDDPLGESHLDGLVFTRRVLQETMRLFPGATAIVRTAARDVEVRGRRFRKGTMCVLATHAFHRRPDFWPDPHAFDPDRFAPGAQQGARPRLAYMPFGGGPRVCMGAAFAMTELVLVLATLVRAVRLEPDLSRPVRIGIRNNGFVADGGMWMKPVFA